MPHTVHCEKCDATEGLKATIGPEVVAHGDDSKPVLLVNGRRMQVHYLCAEHAAPQFPINIDRGSLNVGDKVVCFGLPCVVTAVGLNQGQIPHHFGIKHGKEFAELERA